ncbi:MAG: hypothetical protein ACI4DO_02510 [Roseburia sp.]
MKRKTKRLLSLLLAFAMVLGMLPMTPMKALAYTAGDIAGTTGAGTESDPVIVDTYAEMKAALECNADLYIKVVGFDHTTTVGGRTYRELVANVDYTPGMNQGAIIIPSGSTKHLTIATDIVCYGEATAEANTMWTFIHNRGNLYIDGTGKLAVNFNATYQENGINAIVLNRGELEVSGSVTFDATQNTATPTTAFAIANGNGNTAHTKIYGGTFIASNNTNGVLSYGNSYAVAADDGYIWIFGGEFKATPSGTGTGYGVGGSDGNILLIGGTFEGVYMSPVGTQGKYLSDFLSEGDEVVYRTETGATFDGSTIKKTTEKVRVVKSEKIITGPVEVSVTAPVAGNHPAMTATTTTANVQPNPACFWYPLDENGNIIISGRLGGDDTFEAGKNYAVSVVLLPAEGYEFADTTVVNINGGTAEKSLPTSYKSIQATCYFASEIKAVNMTVSAPEIGKTPNDMTNTYTATGLASGTNWFYASANASSSIMNGATAFAGENTYSAIYQFTIPGSSSAKFAETIGTGDITVNNGTVYAVNRISDKEIQVTVNFPTLHEDIIDEVNMTVSAPQVGKTPNEMTYDATGLIPGAYWFYASANASGTIMSGDTAFVSGNTYSAIYQFTISESSPSKFASTITTSNITVNNGTVYAVNRIDDKKIEVTVNFPTLADENIIDTVNMTVSAPQVGKTPNDMTHSATGLTPGAYWFYASANASGTNMSGGTAFVSGNTYSAIYQFTISESSPSKFASTITTSNITVNNGTVYAVNRISDKKIEVTVNFGELSSTTAIDTIAVTITPPVAGAAPVVAPAGLPTGVTCEPVSSTATGWYDSETNAKMASTDTFVEGKTYYIRLFLSADTGYAFANPVTTATINGGVATKELNNEQYLGIKKSFTATAAATEYDITVTGGKAAIGTETVTKSMKDKVITLIANAPATGKVFDKWVVESGSVTIANVNASTTTFTMPEGAVSIKATYKDAPIDPAPITPEDPAPIIPEDPAPSTPETPSIPETPSAPEAPAIPNTGWYTTENGQKVYYKDGSIAKNQWCLDNEQWYYVNENGAPLTGWQEIGGTWYYFYDDGSMAESAWVGDCYLGASGAWVENPVPESWMQSGSKWWYQLPDGTYAQSTWKKIGGDWYYFDKDGWMSTGWTFDGSDWYYMNASGTMKTGWFKDGASWYYLKPSGAMATGWVSDGGTWYYMDASGAMVTGWFKDGSDWYYMDESGAMKTGWLQDGGSWYYLLSSGAMAHDTVIDGYKLATSGEWVQ